MMAKLKIAFAGLGSRGNAYAEALKAFEDKIEYTAAADIIPDKLERFSKEYGIAPEMQFNSAEEMLAAGKVADIMVVATLDRQHYGHAMPALELGYHLLLEKPISPEMHECLEIADLANKKGLRVVVCHVLRYTPFYRKIKEIIANGTIGEVASIDALENVLYWHQAHSFVRGNWRNTAETSPMILQKCCHDMDIILWLADAHCKSVSSIGSLKEYRPQNAPEGAAKRCNECQYLLTCPYSTDKIYMDRARSGNFEWPVDVVAPDKTMESLVKNLAEGPYGRCVYHCDNDVVDHQVVSLQLDNDCTVCFTMSGLTSHGSRRLHIMGTKGDMICDMSKKEIELTVFGQPTEIIDTSKSAVDAFGHGGGDFGIVQDLVELFDESKPDSVSLTGIDVSIESHIVALAAEESRLNGGKLIEISEFVK
ncbi:MAG: Gfo/Idh/MocA family oxidoreductase [Oscillospiraceae bacterium]|nr:Gfo/Idh/MocA family oxidoreductase [Oscillospiraceae bacterium]